MSVRLTTASRVSRTVAFAAGLGLAAVAAWPQTQVQVVADATSYNVGSAVRVEVMFPSTQPVWRDILATVRFDGDRLPVLDHVPLPPQFALSGRTHATGYRELWKVPIDARTGRYEVDLVFRDPKSREVLLSLPRAVSFVVHRKLVRIDRIGLDRDFYVSGEQIGATMAVENLTDAPLRQLRVEFSDRYWPWIGPYAGKNRIVTVNEALTLAPHQKLVLGHAAAAIAEEVKQPAIRQYAVIIWDQNHKNVYDIAFSPFAFIRPPGLETPKPYPGHYAHSELGAIDTTHYRHFYPAELDSAAIRFDPSHTMWRAGDEGRVRFSLANPTAEPWRDVAVRAHLVGPDDARLASQIVARAMDLDPRPSPREELVTLSLPNRPGLYRLVVEVNDPSGRVLATNTLELGVNVLPKSILVFCAHEDDEVGHGGLYRAAVENHIPIHFLYFTSGNAGSCDRYYQHSCDPAEALNFGSLRMDEARGALAHLGVPSQDIFFLGLPDGGSGEIWYNHLQSSDPYRDALLATEHAPYDGLLHPNLPFARDSVVEATKEFIKGFRPDVIYTAHPSDVRHVDHIVNNYFVVKALQQLLREGAISPDLTLLVDGAHDPGSQPTTPYRYQRYALSVSGEVKALTQEAGWFHQSQGGGRSAAHLRDFNQLPREETFRQVLDWKEHEGWNEKN